MIINSLKIPQYSILKLFIWMLAQRPQFDTCTLYEVSTSFLPAKGVMKPVHDVVFDEYFGVVNLGDNTILHDIIDMYI